MLYQISSTFFVLKLMYNSEKDMYNPLCLASPSQWMAAAAEFFWQNAFRVFSQAEHESFFLHFYGTCCLKGYYPTYQRETKKELITPEGVAFQRLNDLDIWALLCTYLMTVRQKYIVGLHTHTTIIFYCSIEEKCLFTNKNHEMEVH